MRPLEDLRVEFPILQHATYLISASLGAMPRGVAVTLADYADTWATRGVRAWAERWWTLGREVADEVAPIVGAPAGSVSLHENVTTAHQVVLSTLSPPASRDTIVCTAADFPSVIYLLRAQEALGYRLRIVPAEADGSVDASRVASAIDARTALVAVPHVLFRSSHVLDVAPIVERARRVDAPVVLDVYHSAGILPVDVTALGVDFAAGGCLKWLCGGPGTAFLYTRPDLLRALRPRFTGWFAHPAPFDFAIDDFALPEDARRMLNGTPGIPAFHAARPGLRLIAEAAVHRIREASKSLTARLLDGVEARGFPSIAPRDPDRRGGTVAVDVPEGLAVARTLNALDIVVDYRPGAGIRISPHFYNTTDDVDRVVEEIARIVRTKAYSADAFRSTTVT